jgi:ubiquinone/menaquinone biosynthesis C-methylase UbiE
MTYHAVDFPSQYLLLRKKEGRIYSDDQVADLPEVNKRHRYYHEWEMRKRSSVQLKKYLTGQKKVLQILEIGCGNGWLSAKMSDIPLAHVTGIDINTEELNQARRVFRNINNLDFLNCSLQDKTLANQLFDIIVFAASIQYFPLLKNTLEDAIKHLKTGGEIHIIDTNFYKVNELQAARQRSMDYFNAIGFPEMIEHYFHHSLEELLPFNCKLLYDPNSIINRLKKNRNPFYWVCVKGNA